MHHFEIIQRASIVDKEQSRYSHVNIKSAFNSRK